MRLTATKQAMQENNIAVLVVTNPQNVQYLSGYTSNLSADVQVGYFYDPEAILIITHEEAKVMVDPRNEGFESQVGFSKLVLPKNKSVAQYLTEYIKEIIPKGSAVGLELRHLTYEDGDTLLALLDDYDVVDATALIHKLRVFKDEQELGFLVEAARVTDLAYEKAMSAIKPGVTEKSVADVIEKVFRENGMQPSFHTIVASGVVSAIPHYRTGAKKIEAGDTVLLDFGARSNGYHADMSRTVFVGEPDTKQREVYERVHNALEACISEIKPGTTGDEAFEIAVEALGKYAKYFIHSLGHGVGLSIHELPNLTHNSPHVLQEGMVFSIEPGVYIPGWGGVRIEDLAVMTESGVKLLSKSSKELTIIE